MGNPLQKEFMNIYNEPNGTQKLLTYMLDNLSCESPPCLSKSLSMCVRAPGAWAAPDQVVCLAACVHVWGKKESTRKKASEKRKFSKKLRAQGYFNYLTGLDGILLIKKKEA